MEVVAESPSSPLEMTTILKPKLYTSDGTDILAAEASLETHKLKVKLNQNNLN